ncbi:hypothetical protein BJX63DRAFT_432015 [Aspergillus granulosus]|uniref:Zn(2)-C6 fungal-type domain-containing protein n=1 Tax=Aspergillus granulosus TaxID=176169 RepID=A0ABR4HF97_9EURO
MATRACDRCYAIKAKCQAGRDPAACRRCERLGHRCETLRSVQRVGRPRTRYPRSQTSSPSSIGSCKSATASFISNPIPNTPNQEQEIPITSLSLSRLSEPYPIPSISQSLAHPSESTIIEFLFSTTHFIPHFIIGPSFARSMQYSLQTRFFGSSETLLEGFLACAGEFAHRSGLHVDNSSSPDSDSGGREHKERNMTRSAHAIRKLRSLHPTDLATMATMLALGTSILTYDNLAALEGASMICRYLLSQVKSWYTRLVQTPEFDFELNCLIYLDTVECLIRREVPVLRLEIREEGVVDRYVGLVYSLLPVLYDVCMLGWEVKQTGGFGCGNGMLERWKGVRKKVASWQPSPPEGFMNMFTAKEVIAICTQANIYRQLGLLLLHRLRYPFGNEDIAGVAYAEAIFAEVETCERLAGEAPFKIGFPLLVAGFEVVDSAARDEQIQRHFNEGKTIVEACLEGTRRKKERFLV